MSPLLKGVVVTSLVTCALWWLLTGAVWQFVPVGVSLGLLWFVIRTSNAKD